MTKKGFTLVELLVYIALTAILFLLVATLIFAILRAQARNRAVAEVESQGVQIMNQIAQSIRNAAVLNSPAAGTTAASLSINTDSAGNNPTIFSLNGNTLQISENGAVTALHNNLITASALSFKNLTRSGTPGSVAIQFTLTYYNPGARVEYNYTKTFYGAAGLRQ
jgi:type II secretory pathway pseudopilin PulG